MFNDKSVREGTDSQHLEKGGFRGSHLISILDQLHIIEDFNGSLGDLGLDSKGLEEGGLLWAENSTLSGHKDVEGSHAACLSRGCHFVVLNDAPDVSQFPFREHQTYVASDMRQQSVKINY